MLTSPQLQKETDARYNFHRRRVKIMPFLKLVNSSEGLVEEFAQGKLSTNGEIVRQSVQAWGLRFLKTIENTVKQMDPL